MVPNGNPLSGRRVLQSCVAAFFFLAVLFSAAAQDNKALTNKDVLDMVKQGLNDAVIVKVIQASDTKFDTSPEAMTKMQGAGASVKVMDAMLKAEAGKKKAAASPAPVAPANPAPPPTETKAAPDANAGKYLLKEGTPVPLRFAGDISSRYASPGDKVPLTLVADLKVGDVVVVKQGAKAVIVVTSAKKSSMLPPSNGELTLHLEELSSGSVRIRLRAGVTRDSTLGALGKLRHSNMEVDEGTPLTAYVDEDTWLSPAN